MNSDNNQLVIVTGSAGLIGTRVVNELSSDYRVVGMDIEIPENQVAGAHSIQCDLTDDSSVAAALQEIRAEYGHRIASVIHLAAYYDFTGEPSPLYRELTLNGTRRMIRQLQSFEVDQFVFASSILVLKSSQDDRPLNAFSEVDAEWDYPQSKLATENMLNEEHGEIPVVILRVAGVYDEFCHSLPVSQQIDRIYQKQLESYLFPGDKTKGQAFVHLTDLVDCFRRVIASRKDLSDFELLVIGEEDVMSYEELQDELGRLIHGRQWPTFRIPQFAAKAGAWIKNKMAGEGDTPFIKPWMIELADQNYPLDIDRARRKLGWQPRHTLRNSLPQMLDRFHRDKQRWYALNGLSAPEKVLNAETQTESASE